MTFSMATGAECNQVLHHVPAMPTPRRDVMNLQLFDDSAVLAAPTISFQHSFLEHSVFFWVQFESRLFLA